MIAALYVAKGGCYFGLDGVDPWDEARDARKYAGPWPVVAHPPCQRWGKYWHGGPSVKVRKIKGDDNLCFASALADVRRFGGVIEHPAYSAAWEAFGLNAPPHTGGWVSAGFCGGWTCHVEQGHYGHRARKATWLYVCGASSLPSLRWGPSAAKVRLDAGFHSAEERRRAMRRAEATGKEYCCPERLPKTECLATPLAFRDLLIGIARECRPARSGAA